MEQIEIRVETMHCGACEDAIKRAVGNVAGVSEVRADHSTGKVGIDASAPIDLGAIRAAVSEAGFTVVSE